MKKYQYYLCMAALATCLSCEKAVLPESDEPGNDGTPVFRIRVECLEQTGFESRAVGKLEDYCSKMTFVLYDQTGEKVVSLHQDSSEASFGSVSMNVPYGEYHLLVIGHQGEKNCTVKADGGVTFDRASDVTDTFWYYGNVQFSESSSDLSVTLKRVVAKMELTCLDPLPSNVKKVSLKYSQATGTLDLQTGYGKTRATITKDFEITDVMTGQPQTFAFFIFPQEDEVMLNVIFKAYDGYGTEVGGKELKDVPMRRNTITRYQGEIFGRSVGMRAMIEADWQTIDYKP